MKKIGLALGASAAFAAWWWSSAPPDYHPVGNAIVYPAAALEALAGVENSPSFAQALEISSSNLPGHDDMVFLPDRSMALVSAMDGWIWSYDRASGTAKALIDAPLMAAGMHLSPVDPDQLYFCSSSLWGQTYPEYQRVGLYRLNIARLSIEPVVIDVPDAPIGATKVWGRSDPSAPRISSEMRADTRPLAFCNDLDVSADGRRIYFSEPFASPGAGMGGGTVAEAIAHHGNGRIWMHDLASGETRLIAEGFFFPDGLLYDLHPDQAEETAILTSLTPGFDIIRLHIAGPKVGTWEIVQTGLPGMCDGMDRDSEDRIWCGVLAPRSALITWIHGHPWIKHLMLRLPLNWMSPPRKTGIFAFSPDGATALYSAWYEGDALTHIASAVPSPDGRIYLTPFDRRHRGAARIPNPLLTQ